MTRIVVAPNEWIVVCDGRKWLILENAGDEKYPNFKVRQEQLLSDEPTREQGADRPGRVHQSVGTMRSAVGQTDWHDEAERAFLAGLAARINEAVTTGAVKGLVLVAPPRALGMVRPALSTAAGRLVRAEINKDYVNLPVADIEKQLLSG